jgi:hypothetical protein
MENLLITPDKCKPGKLELGINQLGVLVMSQLPRLDKHEEPDIKVLLQVG